MKKSVRPAASKASGDRGKPEAGGTAGGGKPTSKSGAVAPLSKVRPGLFTVVLLEFWSGFISA